MKKKFLQRQSSNIQELLREYLTLMNSIGLTKRRIFTPKVKPQSIIFKNGKNCKYSDMSTNILLISHQANFHPISQGNSNFPGMLILLSISSNKNSITNTNLESSLSTITKMKVFLSKIWLQQSRQANTLSHSQIISPCAPKNKTQNKILF